MGGCILVALGAGGLDAIRSPIDKHPNSPLTVDWRKGTYEGGALRSNSRRLITKLGRPNERGTPEGTASETPAISPHADCYTANEGSEYATFALCTIRVCRGRLLAFGGDPIKSIWLLAETNRGWDHAASRPKQSLPERAPDEHPVGEAAKLLGPRHESLSSDLPIRPPSALSRHRAARRS